MANKTPLASWLYSKRQELNPRFKEFGWPKHWLPGLFDFSTTITWSGIEADGRGVDERREIALEKSVAEAIERLICKSAEIDSVGFAVAGTHDPSIHARNETLERYYLDQHTRYEIPFEHVDERSELAMAFMENNPECEIEFFKMAAPNHLFGIVCSMTSQKDQGISLGFALSESLEDSLRRSMLEALPSYVWLAEKVKNQEDEPIVLPWHIGAEFLQKIQPLLCVDVNQTLSATIKVPELKRSNIAYSDISILKDAPIQVARFLVLNSGGLE